MTSDREYAEGTFHIFAPPEYEEVNEALDGLRILLLAALDREERLREALEEIAKHDDLVAANEDVFSVHAFRRCREVARFALDEPHGNFSDTQDTNPEGGC